ncbi:Hypothetical protein PACV_403 [Pacmanvirus A23]|uniref:Hypothetical protein n=1 Tax=Pacmanvirus A23 TaxID=1932881 RepID=UPI000A0927C5|nr:Hypothetical protein B9W72_gp399 [Pacmanvirus A23]SIP86116.1 Hypothetical protein PACV_403 [Pacmanvirus A23]
MNASKRLSYQIKWSKYGFYRNEIYAYYLRCVEFINKNNNKYYRTKTYKFKKQIIPRTKSQLFKGHHNGGDNSLIKTITYAHKLHDKMIRWNDNQGYHYDYCECGSFDNDNCGRCECGNTRGKLTQKNVTKSWIDDINLDSIYSISNAVHKDIEFDNKKRIRLAYLRSEIERRNN